GAQMAGTTSTVTTSTATIARDPGVRGGPAGAGGPIAGLTTRQSEFFTTGKADFEEVESVADGLGPRMNLDSWAGCRSQPAASGSTKKSLGIAGHPNLVVSGRAITGRTNNNGNDGTIARFGWKAQNQTLLLFSGEAYNVEMGITNELFQQEREQDPNCQFAT